MLSSSLDTLLKVSKTTSYRKLFGYECVQRCIRVFLGDRYSGLFFFIGIPENLVLFILYRYTVINGILLETEIGSKLSFFLLFC